MNFFPKIWFWIVIGLRETVKRVNYLKKILLKNGVRFSDVLYLEKEWGVVGRNITKPILIDKEKMFILKLHILHYLHLRQN
jgi:hypothetical protein